MSNFDIRRRAVRRSTMGLLVLTAVVGMTVVRTNAGEQAESLAEYRVLATNRTSTMERELNEAAEEGFQLEAVMGGDTAFGGSEVVVVVGRRPHPGRYAYRLLATSKTSTMQTELQAAATAGFVYRDQTVFETALGGEEVVVILERDKEATSRSVEYQLLATSRTSTLEKELQSAAARGYELIGLTVGETAFGGTELVAITRRELP